MVVIISKTDLLVIVGKLHEVRDICKRSDIPLENVKHVIRREQLNGLGPPHSVVVIVGETIDDFIDHEEIIEFLKYRESQGWFKVHHL